MSTCATLQLFPAALDCPTKESIYKLTNKALLAKLEAAEQANSRPETRGKQSKNEPASTVLIDPYAARQKKSDVLIPPWDQEYLISPFPVSPPSSRSSSPSPASANVSPQKAHDRRDYDNNICHSALVAPLRTRTVSPCASAESCSISPAMSRMPSDRSQSSTIISALSTRSNSIATQRSFQTSSIPEVPLIRSMFQQNSHNMLPSHSQTPPPVPKKIPLPELDVQVAPTEASDAPYSPDSIGLQSDADSFCSRSQNMFHSTSAELLALWEMANGQVIDTPYRPIRLQIHHGPLNALNPHDDRILSFGHSPVHPFYSIFTPNDSAESHPQVVVRRHFPGEEASSIPVTDFPLSQYPTARPSSAPQEQQQTPSPIPDNEVTTSFTPKLATLLALDQATQTLKACQPLHPANGQSMNSGRPVSLSRAVTDPAISSALAASANLEADRFHGCIVLFEPGTREYFLCHPSLGILPIQIHSAICLPSKPSAASSTRPTISGKPTPSKPTGAVTIFTPPSIESAIPHRPLATLDLATEILTVDAGAMQFLNDLYIVDTAVSVLAAVALAEHRRHLATYASNAPSIASSGKEPRKADGAKESSFRKLFPKDTEELTRGKEMGRDIEEAGKATKLMNAFMRASKLGSKS